MGEMQMGVIETRFAQIIWEREPITTSELVSAAAEELGWKRTTAYTVLKRLCDKGIFRNDGGVITSLISHDEFYAIRSERFINEEFKGSLPAFLTAFTSRKALSEQEIEQLRAMIDSYGE